MSILRIIQQDEDLIEDEELEFSEESEDELGFPEDDEEEEEEEIDFSDEEEE